MRASMAPYRVDAKPDCNNPFLTIVMSQSFKSTTSAFLSGLTTLEPLSRKINPGGANADAELQDIVNLAGSSILSGVYTRSGRRDLTQNAD